MISIVHKTIFLNPSNVSNGSFNLSTPSTIGNWLVIVSLYRDDGFISSLSTDQGEFVTQFGGVNALSPSGLQIVLDLFQLHTTKVANSISYSGGISIPTFIVYELSASSSFATSFQGTGTKSETAIASIVGPAHTTASNKNAVYFSLCATGGLFGATVASVSPASWVLDNLAGNTGNGTCNAGVAVLLNVNGAQQATFNLSPSDDGSTAVSVFSETAALTTTTTTVTSNDDPSNVGQNVIFTATINGPGGTGSPTGTVTFSIDGKPVAPRNVTAVSTGISQAQYSIATLKMGTHVVVAVYSGDSAYNPSTSPVLNQIVNCVNDWMVGLQYDPTWNNVAWSQPGGPSTIVFPQQENSPWLNYPVPGQWFVELTGLWVSGCGHWQDFPLIIEDFDCTTGKSVALVCCSLCSYLNYVIEPFSSAVYSDPQFGIPIIII